MNTGAFAVGDVQRFRFSLRALSNATRTFAEASHSSAQLVDAIVCQTGQSLRCVSVLALLNDATDTFTAREAYTLDPSPGARAALRAAVIDAGPQRVEMNLVAQSVLETRRPAVIPHLPVEELTRPPPEGLPPFAREVDASSVITLPLSVRGRVAGLLTLARVQGDPGFDDHDAALAQSMAEHASLAMATAFMSGALGESEEALRVIFDATPLALFVFDDETLLPLAVNAATVQLYGYSREEFMCEPVSRLSVKSPAAIRKSVSSLGSQPVTFTGRHRCKDGRELVVEYTLQGLSFAGRLARVAIGRDVTARHAADQDRALLAAIVESSNDAIVSKDLQGKITSWNPAAERLFGYAPEEAIGRPITMLIPPDRLDEAPMLIERVAAGNRVDLFETIRRRKDGDLVRVLLSLAPIRDAAGTVMGISKTARDLTAQRQAEDSLKRAEEQLRQAQKMEAIGRLAGGVAHDVNNVLSVILGYSAMILEDLDSVDPLAVEIDEMRKAALRAADLTRQLLLFSRQQIAVPRVLDPNELVSGMEKMLRRILGEDVELDWAASTGLGCVCADPSNLEQVVMNLAVNARDAMPTGGRLTIRAHNVNLDANASRLQLGATPGPHVVLEVSDTGVGMDEATQARIFEPFFTTKDPGKGTGLGLSTVFGIIQQAKGNLEVESAPTKGTTFRVYLPRVEAAVDLRRSSIPPLTLRGSETVLVVEDQAQVRAVVEGILKRNGYNVLVAENAGEAILHVERHAGPIHLLLTDVVMPGMSGPELAKRIASVKPTVRVLFMSGYTDDRIVRHGVFEKGLAFLQKPFTPASLTRGVREALDSPRTRPLE